MSRLKPVLVGLVVLVAPRVGAQQLPPPGSAQVLGNRAAQAARESEQAADLGDPMPASIGDTNADLVFTPLTPCRIIDTRLSGGIRAANTTRDFFVAGATGFTGQGGNASGCNVPDGPATAVMINFVAVNPTGAGHLQATAWVGPSTLMPNASILNYGNLDPNLNAIANGIALPICNPAAMTCDFDLRVQANVNPTHVVADVVGYFRTYTHGVPPVPSSPTAGPRRRPDG